MKILVSKWVRPYKANLKTAFPSIKGKSGIYLVKKGNTIIYVGYSETNLYRTLYRHFQTWTDRRYCPNGIMSENCNHSRTSFYQDTPMLSEKQRNAGKKKQPERTPRQEKIDYLNEQEFKIKVALCPPKKAASLEKSLIKKYKPEYNDNKLEMYELTAYDKNSLNEFIATEPAPEKEFTTGKDDDAFEMPF